MKICGFDLADWFMGKREENETPNIIPSIEETQSLLKKVLDNEMNEKCFKEIERVYCYLNTTKFYEYQDKGFELNIDITSITRTILRDENIICMTRKVGNK